MGCQERFWDLLGTEADGVRRCGSLVKGLVPSPTPHSDEDKNTELIARCSTEATPETKKLQAGHSSTGKHLSQLQANLTPPQATAGESLLHVSSMGVLDGQQVDADDIVPQGQRQGESSEQTHQERTKDGTSAVGTGATKTSSRNFGVNPKLSEDWGTDVFEIPPKIRDDFYDMWRAKKNGEESGEREDIFPYLFKRIKPQVERASNCLVEVLFPSRREDLVRIILCGTAAQRRIARKYFELLIVLEVKGGSHFNV